jgi:hypothetical protein
VCLDGAKGDREVWLGDFFHAAKLIPVSTSRNDHITGTLSFVLDRQIANGPLPINALMGQPVDYPDLSAASGLGLADYQILGLLAFHTYVLQSGDIEYAAATWPKWKRQIDWMMSYVDNSTHLVTFSGFLGDANGTAVSALMVQGLNSAATVASILDNPVVSKYTSAAATIANE